MSEDLSLKLSPDARSYAVEARYVLSNPGAPLTVSYAVPITWGLMDEFSPEEDIQKAGASISIELGGARQACKVEKVAGGPQIIGVPEQLGVDNLPIGAWCLASLSVPTGAAVPLTLRYTAATSFVDGSTSKSALTSFAPRDIIYPLFPAGGWAGKPKLNATVDLGVWADDGKVVYPSGFKRSGSTWTYSNPSADLSALGEIVARVDVEQAERFQTAATLNASKGQYSVKLMARASSTLAGGTYEAVNLTDGKVDTAWCEGVEGDGVNQWVELRAAPGTKLEEYCQLEGLAVVPGYSKSQAVYANNGRVRDVTVGACGASSGATIPLKPSQRYDRAVGIVPITSIDDSYPLNALGEKLSKDPQGFCVRLTISAVDKGAKFQDTCIAEIGALINCG